MTDYYISSSLQYWFWASSFVGLPITSCPCGERIIRNLSILISWLLIVAFNVNNRWNVVFKPVYIEKSQGGGLTSQVLPDQTIDSRNFCQYKLQILNLKTEEKAGGFATKTNVRWVFACANNCLNPLFYGIVGKRSPLLSLTMTKNKWKSHYHIFITEHFYLPGRFLPLSLWQSSPAIGHKHLLRRYKVYIL